MTKLVFSSNFFPAYSLQSLLGWKTLVWSILILQYCKAVNHHIFSHFSLQATGRKNFKKNSSIADILVSGVQLSDSTIIYSPW